MSCSSTRRLALIVLYLVLTTATLTAATETWESHTRTGEYAFAVGDTDRALEEFEAALEIAQRFPPPDRRLETSLGNLARLYEHQSRPAEALPMYQLQVAATEYRVGNESPALLQPLMGTARTAMATGDIPSAEGALLRYRAIAASSDAADPSQHWIALAMLARSCTLQGRDDAALAYQREAVAVLDDARGPTEAERANALESLAQMELLHGDPAAAEALLVRAVELRTADEDGGGAAVMLTAGARTALGAGEAEVAENLGQRALTAAADEGIDTVEIDQVLADAAWMRVRRGSESLGDLYLGASPGPELDLAYQRLMEVHGAVGQDTDPTVIGDNLSRLARVAALRGEVADCAHWQRLFIDLQQELSGANSSAAIAAQDNLVGLFTAAGRTDDAVTANAWLIAMQDEAWGADSPRLRPALERQLELLTAAKLKKQAKAVKKRLKKLK